MVRVGNDASLLADETVDHFPHFLDRFVGGLSASTNTDGRLDEMLHRNHVQNLRRRCTFIVDDIDNELIMIMNL